MAIAPPDPHTAKFLGALNEFVQNSPNQLSPEIQQALVTVGKELKGYNADQQSPGQKEAAKYTDGTGAHYSEAAKGPDQPSPGQREFAAAAQQMASQVKA